MEHDYPAGGDAADARPALEHGARRGGIADPVTHRGIRPDDGELSTAAGHVDTCRHHRTDASRDRGAGRDTARDGGTARLRLLAAVPRGRARGESVAARALADGGAH